MIIKGIAHRGDPLHAPENTLSAFQLAVDASYSHIELDVQLSKDGIPVVFHDYTIDRLCNGSGYLRHYTYQQLQQFKVMGSETIPTLEEVLRLLKGRVHIMIELKQLGDLYPTLEERVLDIVSLTDTQDQCSIISFDHISIAKVRSLNSDIDVQLLCGGNLPYIFPYLKELKSKYLHVPYPFMTKAYADLAEANGIILNPAVVDKMEDLLWIADNFPLSIITTNELDRWAEIYRTRPQLHSI